MKKQTTKSHFKLQLSRETLRTLVPAEAALDAGLTSACKSGWTCCNGTCGF